MSQNYVSRKGRQSRFLLLMCTAIAIWAALPFIVDLFSTTTHAQAGIAPGLVANLTGDPIADATPRGFASYYVAPSGTPPARQLYVSVSNVNLAAGTSLGVSLNTTSIGTITLDDHRHGALVLSTFNGGTVPTVVAGDALTVSNGDAAILTGTFAPPPTPSPTSTHTPFPTPSHTPFPTPSHTPFPTPSHTPFPTPSPLPPHLFGARMNGANEVPPVTTNALGFGFAALNSAETQVRVCVAYRNLSSAATAITINGPASTSENGPVIFTLTLPSNSIGFSSQTFDVTAEQVADLRARLWYFQVATSNNVDGEIRGQLNPITPHIGGGTIGGAGGGGNLSTTHGSDDTGGGDYDRYVPVPFDFDGDGITDIAVFRASEDSWYVTQSSNGRTVVYQFDVETE